MKKSLLIFSFLSLLVALSSCGGIDDAPPYYNGPEDATNPNSGGNSSGDDYVAGQPETPNPGEAKVPAAVADADKYQLVWSDEFNDPRDAQGRAVLPSSSNWTFETGGSGWGNNEDQYYVDKIFAATQDTVAKIVDGCLVITAIKLPDGVTAGTGAQARKYISARMNTPRATRSWQYGYIEMRATLPPGRGTWPAFWMLPGNGQYALRDGEIDIMEYVGVEPGIVWFSAHSEGVTTNKTGPNGEKHSSSIRPTNPESIFHTYALEWTADYVKGYVDGVCYHTYNNPKRPTDNATYWPFDKPFYLKLNIAVGGAWGGYQGIDDTIFPTKYVIDYVRVFQKQ